MENMYRRFGIGAYDTVQWADIVDTKLRSEFETRIPIKDITDAQEARDRKLMSLLRHKARDR